MAAAAADNLIYGQQYNGDDAMAFLFRRVTNPGAPYAARVYFPDNNELVNKITPGTPFRPRTVQEAVMAGNTTTLSTSEFQNADLKQLGFAAIDIIPNDSGSGVKVRMPNGQEIPEAAIGSVNASLLLSMMLNSTGGATSTAESASTFSSGMMDYSTTTPTPSFATASTTVVGSNLSALPTWSVLAENVDSSLTTYGLETQQQPDKGVIDLLELGTQYILGQDLQSVLGNGTKNNNSISPAVLRSIPVNKRVEGPVQCGPNQPCLDGSCCNKDGKCGFKQAQCDPENCLSNCNATAMCSIDSADHKTPCGLKLCCSYYR